MVARTRRGLNFRRPRLARALRRRYVALVTPPIETPSGARFDPLVEAWFTETFKGPTPPQEAGWKQIAAGRDTLIAAPTGSGKTLAAFLWAIDELVRAAREDRLEDATAVVYVSPLKALGNDIEK